MKPASEIDAMFDDASSWKVFSSGEARGDLKPIKSGLGLDFDFHGGGGFVVMRREMILAWPGSFRLSFRLRGDGPDNHFEFKVADPSGENVWRHQRLNHRLTKRGEIISLTERDLPFAWGPAGGGSPEAIGAVEFVIAAGPGGEGSIELSDCSFANEQITAETTAHAPPTPWRADPRDKSPAWSVDFGRMQRFGGVLIHWPDDLPARSFVIGFSNDGASWTDIRTVKAATGPFSAIPLPRAETRYLRLKFAKASQAAITAIEIQPDAFSASPNEFLHHLAALHPRGLFPRYWLREQSYWTPVGPPAGGKRALINEEGMLEIDEAGFSLEPFLTSIRKLITWADSKNTCHLEADGIPMPSVTRKTRNTELEVTPWIEGKPGHQTLHVTYRVTMKPGTTERLVLLARPFQVNPPWQAFRNLGGVSPISRIRIDGESMNLQGRVLTPSRLADSWNAAAFLSDGMTGFLTDPSRPDHGTSARVVTDSDELATAAWSWTIPARAKSFEVTISMPYQRGAPSKGSRRKALAEWRRTLCKVTWKAPKSAQAALDCFRSTAGHILINRDGPAIQPGPRRYTRSWVRDCVIMGAALAKAGQTKPLREFLTWYARFQRDDGFVPCVVDRDGVDWLVEHDSHGQFLWGVREAVRYGASLTWLKPLLPSVDKAADYLTVIRHSRITEAYRNPPLHDRYGLLPESASHEGYLAHPVHSYWDDFWGIRGLEAAADLTGNESYREEATALQQDTLRSMRTVIRKKSLRYLPGSVEWADFDPTATSNAIAQLDFADALPKRELKAMLDTYLKGVRDRISGKMPWKNYTAYEIRIIGAMVRLGRRDDANELLDFFLSDRRPNAWNQWPEITWRDARSPGHLGDVPHTWIAAEFLLVIASMVAMEREAGDSLVLAAGLRWDWITGSGFSVKGLPTRYGTLDFSLRAMGTGTLHVRIGQLKRMPQDGIILTPPLPDGTQLAGGGKTLVIERLPFRGSLDLRAHASKSDFNETRRRGVRGEMRRGSGV